MDKELTTTTEAAAVIQAQSLDLFNLAAFKEAYHIAGVLSKSQLIPKAFQGNVTDCIIAMEMAQRIGAGVFAVMQSLYIVHGKPGWSATFIIGALNACGRFAPIRFDITEPVEKTLNGKKIMDRVCIAWTIEKGTGEKLTGPPVSIEMAHKEGWFEKNGSKWQTMPELMLRYRAATFFGRLYAPDILMGMRTAEELHDYPEVTEPTINISMADELNSRFLGKEIIDEETGEVVTVKEEPSSKEEPPVTAKESSSVQPTSPDEPSVPPQPTANQEKHDKLVGQFIKEISSHKTSMAVDQWRSKHHNRVANAFGGSKNDGYLAVMDFAEVKFNELSEVEKETKGGNGNASMF